MILDELARQAEIGQIEHAIYFAAVAYQPRSMSELALRARVSRNAATKACRTLVALGWMRLERSSRRVHPIAIVPHRCQELLAARLRVEYNLTALKGEFLMKRYLDLSICTRFFVDNAHPQFLENPMTGHLVEYDRYYDMHKVAFEFNGSQHHETTEVFADQEKVDEIRTRDAVKAGLSGGEQVRLIVVTPENLLPRSLDALLPDGLPKCPVDYKGPYFKTLNELCIGYVRAVYQHRKAQQSKAGRGV